MPNSDGAALGLRPRMLRAYGGVFFPRARLGRCLENDDVFSG